MEAVHAEILGTAGANVYIVPCVFCDRKGHLPIAMRKWDVWKWSHTEECPVCDGQGVIEIESPDWPVPDAYCNGTGHEPHAILDEGLPGTRCHKCGGIGIRSLHGAIECLGKPRS